MGILTKMLGMKIFLLLSLAVLGYSMPQPELRIIIHLHGVDNFQPGPARGSPRGRSIEGGSDYSDDDAEAVDEAEIPTGDVVPNGDVIPNEEVELAGNDEEEGEGSVSGDPSGQTEVVEAGADYSDYRWNPPRHQRYPGRYGGGNGFGRFHRRW